MALFRLTHSKSGQDFYRYPLGQVPGNIVQRIQSMEKFFEPILKYMKHHSSMWVAGGSVVRWLEGADQVKPGDFDLFAKEPANFWQLEQPDTMTSWARTYKLDDANRVQVITRPYESLEEVLDGFHMTVTQTGLDIESGELVVGPTTLSDIHNKKMKRHNPSIPSSAATALHSFLKYAARGYTMDYDQVREFLKGWDVPGKWLNPNYGAHSNGQD